MDTVKIGKKGQVTIPRRVLEATGLTSDAQLIVQPEPDGSIRLRPAAVYPIELYSDERIAELEAQNRVSGALRQRVKDAIGDGNQKT
jgi:AbrB family looped-hinge helix DNA binding protein